MEKFEIQEGQLDKEKRQIRVERGGMVTELSVGKAGHLAGKHDWIKLEPQPNNQTVVVKCHRCGVTQTMSLPERLDAVSSWLDQVDRAHGECVLAESV
jgi:hypothetical protein